MMRRCLVGQQRAYWALLSGEHAVMTVEMLNMRVEGDMMGVTQRKGRGLLNVQYYAHL